MSNSILIANNIHKSFLKGQKTMEVLRGVHLEIAAHQCIAITGASGVGKSTLLHILGALDQPTQGQLLWGAQRENILTWSGKKLAHFRNQNLGFVFQFHYLLPECSALENVMMPALIAGQSRSQASQRASEILQCVGLAQRLSHWPAELSGGEQQRVALARALMMKPALLLADEPTGNLDAENRSTVIKLLLKMNQDWGTALVLVTHDLELAQQMQQVRVMREGRLF